MAKKHADFLILGSGPAGQRAAVRASKLGKRVVIVEKWGLGGSSVHTGTIPSKTLRQAIMDLTDFSQRSFYAHQIEKQLRRENISISDLNFRVNWVKDHLKDTMEYQLRKNGVEVVFGVGEFIDPHTVKVTDNEGEREYSADKILIATGSRPRNPEGIPFDGKRVLDSTQLLRIEQIPSSLIVLGAGVIGSEYASMFSILGTEVILVDKRPRIMGYIDREIGSHLYLALKEHHFSFLGQKEYEKIVKTDDAVELHCKDQTVIKAQAILVAAGREANVEKLSLERAGLSLTKNGYLAVNAQYQTMVPHIYAAGDVTGIFNLSSTAFVQGQTAAECAFGDRATRVPEYFPWGIYTVPEVSYVGKTEEDLIKANITYDVGRAYFYEVSRCIITGTDTGVCKLLFDPQTHRLLGVHIFGRSAAELIHIAQLAMDLNVSIEYFVKQVFNYPTFAEMYRIAALDGLQRVSTRESSKIKG